MRVIDEAGNRYGRWLVIRRAENSKEGRAQWMCRCDCGNEKVVAGKYLRNGGSQSCGCLRREAAIDMVGQEFGRLTVLARAGSSSWRSATWLCRCNCGKEAVVLGKSLRAGLTRSCGCLQHDACSLPSGEAAFNAIMRQMTEAARVRGLEWSLSKAQVRALTVQPCCYCGAEPAQGSGRLSRFNGAFLYNGLDRQDNSLGYIIKNVVPCCMACNKAKGTMTVAEFKSWIARAHSHFCK